MQAGCDAEPKFWFVVLQVSVGDCMYAIGGMQSPHDDLAPLLEELDLRSNTWRLVEPPTHLHQGRALVAACLLP